jgi:hypothetical protein
MNFANDSMHTCLCLQFDPQDVATATVYLAGQFAKVKSSNDKVDWLVLLGNPDVETLASIALQILELIVERKGADQGIFNKIKGDLEALKKEKTPVALPDAKRARIV